MCHNDHCHRNHYRHDHTPPRIPPRPSPPKTIHHSYYHQYCNNKEHCNLEDYQQYDHYTVITTASTTIITTTTSIVNMTFMTMMYQSLLKNSQVYIDANMLLYGPELWCDIPITVKNSQVYIDANMLLYGPELWWLTVCGGSVVEHQAANPVVPGSNPRQSRQYQKNSWVLLSGRLKLSSGNICPEQICTSDRVSCGDKCMEVTSTEN